MSGAFDKHPERRAERADEPQIDEPVGPAPSYFDAGQVECWNELAREGAAWLTLAARKPLEQAAKLLADDRRSRLDVSEGKRYDSLLRDLGFGPVAITRVKGRNAKPQTKLSKYA